MLADDAHALRHDLEGVHELGWHQRAGAPEVVWVDSQALLQGASVDASVVLEDGFVPPKADVLDHTAGRSGVVRRDGDPAGPSDVHGGALVAAVDDFEQTLLPGRAATGCGAR
jgi:hypothetical protein